MRSRAIVTVATTRPRGATTIFVVRIPPSLRARLGQICRPPGSGRLAATGATGVTVNIFCGSSVRASVYLCLCLSSALSEIIEVAARPDHATAAEGAAPRPRPQG